MKIARPYRQFSFKNFRTIITLEHQGFIGWQAIATFDEERERTVSKGIKVMEYADTPREALKKLRVAIKMRDPAFRKVFHRVNGNKQLIKGSKGRSPSWI